MFKSFISSTKGLGEGDRCDGGSDDDDDDDDEEDSREASRSKSKSRRGRGNVKGASERRAYGDLKEAKLECQEGLVCMDVGSGRETCQPENEDGKHDCCMWWKPFTLLIVCIQHVVAC